MNLPITSNDFNPYADESQVIQLDDFQIQNRLDKVTLSGEIDLTKDQSGLENALILLSLLQNVVATLQSTKLPDHQSVAPVRSVRNPFL